MLSTSLFFPNIRLFLSFGENRDVDNIIIYKAGSIKKLSLHSYVLTHYYYQLSINDQCTQLLERKIHG